MRFFAFAALLPAVLGLASERRDSGSCASLQNNQELVAQLVVDYANLIGDYSDALGESYLADDFTDTSGSINALAGLPLDSVTFPSKAAFMANQVCVVALALACAHTHAQARPFSDFFFPLFRPRSPRSLSTWSACPSTPAIRLSSGGRSSSGRQTSWSRASAS